MTSVLHISGGPHDRSALESLRAAGVEIIEARALPLPSMDPQVDAAVIEPDVEAPVRVARSIHAASPEAHIVFVTTRLTEPALRRELLLAPRIGSRWSLASAGSPAVALTIQQAMQSAMQRRQMSTTIGRMNRRIGQQMPARRTVVSDHFLAAVLYQLSDGVVMLDRQGRVVSMNDAARRVFGPNVRRGASFLHTVSGGASDLERSLLAGDEDLTSEIVIPGESTHRRRILEVRLTKVKDNDGHAIGTAILARDITQRRAAEERERFLSQAGLILASTMDLEVAMQRLVEHIVTSHAAVAVIDLLEGNAVVRRGAAAASPHEEAGRRLKSFSTAKIPDHPAMKAFATGEIVVENDVSDERLRGFASSEEHLRILRKIELRSFVAVPIAAGKELIGGLSMGCPDAFNAENIELFHELSRVIASAVSNIWLYHAAEQANRAKEEFLATLSHELRTPMTSILGWIQLLRSAAAGENLTREGLEAMEQSARVQAQLIDDLLDLSRIQMGKLHVEVQPVRLGEVVRAAVDTIRPAANAKRITLHFDDVNAPIVNGDPNRLQQVVWNLLSNSIKFTDPGGSVSVRVKQESSRAQVEVRDSGAGIDPQFLPMVFERFRQADSASTRQFGGLGLGLSIVKQLVELHGGRVRVESEGLGRGATFIFTLPIPAVAVDVSTAEVPPEAQPRSILSGVTLVLVEDDPASATILRVLLERAGARVHCTTNVRDALEAIRQHRPDVLVSDLAMPERDGISLIREIRSTLRIPPESLPALALSAFSDSKIRVEVLGAGFQRLLQKPVDATALTATVAELAATRAS